MKKSNHDCYVCNVCVIIGTNVAALTATSVNVAFFIDECVRIISAPMMPIKDFNTSDGGLGMT